MMLKKVQLWLALSLCGTVGAEPVLSSGQKARLAELRERARSDWREGQKHQRDLDYGPIFLSLALHDSDPNAVARWLVLADGLYSPRPEATRSRQLLKIDEDFLEVGLWASRHARANVRSIGTRMLGHCLGNPSPRAQERAVEMALKDSHPKVRQGAIHAFWFPVNFQPVVDEAVAECLLRCLEDHHVFPRVEALVLCRRTYRKKRQFPARLELRLREAERRLLSDSEAVVVGHAVEALGQFQLGKKGDVKWLYPLLKHSDPFVRGCAAQTLGEFAEPASLEKLMALVDDSQLATVTLPVPEDETGIKTGAVYTPGNRSWSVGEFALRAIQQASSQSPAAFVFEANGKGAPDKRVDEVRLEVGQRIPSAQRQAFVAERARLARSWWRANASLLGPQD